jgi:hypothetical protein
MPNLDEKYRGIYHAAEYPELFEPQRQNNFQIQVVFTDDIVSPDSNPDSDNPLMIPASLATEVIRLSIDSTGVPTFSQNALEIMQGNNRMYFAGKPTFSTFSIKLKQYIGRDAKQILLGWQYQSYNPHTQKVGLAKDYKKTAYLYEYTPNWELVSTTEILGCWLPDLKFDEKTVAGEGAVCFVTGDIRYDSWKPVEFTKSLASQS